MDPLTGLPSPRRLTVSGESQYREGVTVEHRDWTLVRAGDLVANQEVVIIDGDTPVEEACDPQADNIVTQWSTITDATRRDSLFSSFLQILTKHKISSAPVYDSTAKNFVGMFDWADVMSYLLIVLKKKSISEQQSKSEEELTSEFKNLIKLATQCQPIPVKLASDLSNKNPFYSVLPETTLFHVVELFGTGTHRVAVVDANGKIKGMLTQSRVVSYLYENVSHFPQVEKLFPKTIKELQVGNDYVISVQAGSFVLDALTTMSKEKLSSIAVINDEGKLLGNISMSDIKYVLRNYRHSLLWRTCHQFVSHVRSRQGMEDGQDRYPVFDVRATSTLGYTIAKMAATRAHRVWVVDDKMYPAGVVSMTDVLSAFARDAGGKAEPIAKRHRSASVASATSSAKSS